MSASIPHAEHYEKLGINPEDVQQAFIHLAYKLDPDNYNPGFGATKHTLVASYYASHDADFSRTAAAIHIKGIFTLRSVIDRGLIGSDGRDTCNQLTYRLDRDGDETIQAVLDKDVRRINAEDITKIKAFAADMGNGPIHTLIEEVASVQAILQVKGYTMPGTRSILLEVPEAAVESFQRLERALRSDAGLIAKITALAADCK